MGERSSELKEWVEKNPLRVWRKLSGYTIMEVAVMLDVSAITVTSWERGLTLPNNRNWVKLAEMMVGVSDWDHRHDETTAEWMRWHDSRPGV